MADDEFSPVPLGPEQIPLKRESIRGWSLVLIAFFGVALVVSGTWTSLEFTDLPQVWSSLQIDLGIGVLLFALLFQVERVVVRRHVDPLRQHLEDITPRTMSDLARTSPNDLTRVTSSDGPVGRAFEWVEAMLSGDYETVWELSDANWQLCRVQAWIFNNLDALGLATESEADDLARTLVAGPSSHPRWHDFATTERDQFVAAWRGVDSADLGVASKRRCVGPGYELVVMTPMGDRSNGYVVHAPSVLPTSLLLLMGRSDGKWRLAAFGAQAPPTPGWPPAWWIVGDPAAEAATDAM